MENTKLATMTSNNIFRQGNNGTTNSGSMNNRWGTRDSSNNNYSSSRGWGLAREPLTRGPSAREPFAREPLAREPLAREQTNYSNPSYQRPSASVLHQEPVPEPSPAIIIDDFPALGGLSAKPKPVIAKSFLGAAKEGASIVKPEPVKKKLVVEETEQHNTNNVRSGRMRMTLAEYLERKEEGERIDEDDVSICSEYSNNVIDGESDDDNDDDEAF